MARRVRPTPSLPTVTPDVRSSLEAANRALYQDGVDTATRLNVAHPKDGTEDFEAPFPFLQILTADLVLYDVVEWEGCILYNTQTNKILWSNGVAWIEVGDVPAGSIQTADLEDLAVTTAKIAADAVTNAKLADMAASTFKMRVTGSTGNPEDGTVAQALAILAALTGGALQVFTSDGAYTPTAGMKFCLVISTGAGGGGGSVTSDGTTHAAASPGSSGATCIELFLAAAIGASKAVTVGVGGPGGTAGGNGTNGEDTTFDTLHTAGGGVGGVGFATNLDNTGVTAPSAGGVATGGHINIPGAPSPLAWTHTVAGSVGTHGGAASFWGGGVNGFFIGAVGIQAGITATIPGASGSGAIARDALDAGGQAGGAGANGIVAVLEFF